MKLKCAGNCKEAQTYQMFNVAVTLTVDADRESPSPDDTDLSDVPLGMFCCAHCGSHVEEDGE